MAKKERNQGSVGRARAKRGSSETPRGRAILGLDENSYIRTGDSFRGPIHRAQVGMPPARTASAMAMPSVATRPMPNPRRSVEAPGSGLDQGPAREEMERGTSAPGRSPRPIARRKDGGKVKKMAYGGKVKKMKDGGFPDLNKDGKVTKADILQGRGVKKMAMGGKCRGMGAATKGGNYSRG